MTRKSWLGYGAAIGVAAFALRWLEYRYAARVFTTEIYVVVIAVTFTALGIWVGNRLTRGGPPAVFRKNVRALESLGISAREYEILELLVDGHSNREIADRLFVSPNTVKTHLAHIYEKLGVSRRGQAVRKAQLLRLVP